MTEAETVAQEPAAAPAGAEEAGAQGMPLGERDPAETAPEAAPKARASKAAAKKSNAAAPRPPARVAVTFIERPEFLAELEEDAGEIERGIVRVTLWKEPPGENVGMQTVTVIAGYVAGGQVIELREVIGTTWGTGAEQDLRTADRAKLAMEQIVAAVTGADLEIRPGRYGAL